MLLPALTFRHFLLLGLMLASLVLLADGVARLQLAQAVRASQAEGARMFAHAAGAVD